MRFRSVFKSAVSDWFTQLLIRRNIFIDVYDFVAEYNATESESDAAAVRCHACHGRIDDLAYDINTRAYMSLYS